MSRRRVVVVLAAVVLVAAAAVLWWVRDGQGRVLEAGGVSIVVAERSSSAMHAYSEVELAVVGDCLGADDRVIVWPHGTSVAEDEPLRVEIPGVGVRGLGDHLEMGGGSFHQGAGPVDPELADVYGVNVPPGCAGYDLWVMAPED